MFSITALFDNIMLIYVNTVCFVLIISTLYANSTFIIINTAIICLVLLHYMRIVFILFVYCFAMLIITTLYANRMLIIIHTV